MKLRLYFILLVLVIFAFNAPFAAAQDAIQVPVGNMVIKAPPEYVAKKPPVFFMHSSHLKFSCLDCHHDWEQEGDVTGCNASGCHEKAMPSPPSGKPSQLQRTRSIAGAYHGACLRCHREERNQALQMNYKQFANTIPVKCEGCHNENYKDQDYSHTFFTLPMGTLKIKPPEEIYAKRSAVNFPHDLHFQQDCQACHHDWDGESEIEGCMTSGCHDQFEPDEGTRDINDPDNVLYYLTAYHKTCYKCHQEMSSANNDGPPTKCDGCHNDE